MSRITRRALLGAGLGAGALGGWALAGSGEGPGAPPPNPAPVSVRLSPRLTLHRIQTGWVSVKAAHRAFGGPDALRLPAILADRRWTEWLPVTAWAVEHPEGVTVVDTGETARILGGAYPDTDPVTAFFYRRNLRFALSEEQEVGPQMERLGLLPDRVERVVLTHLHSDHMGGLRWFSQAQVLVSERDASGHAGALVRHLPQERVVPVAHEPAREGAFSAAAPVTADGAVLVVPTPGHSPGHQSVLLRAGDRTWLLAGDAAFSLGQVRRGEVAGIVEDPGAARATLRAMREQMDAHGTVLLPSHDPGSAERVRT